MRRKAGFAGIDRLRRKLRRMDPEISRDVKLALESGAQSIRDTAIGMVPRDTGDLADSIHYKVGRDGLSVAIGPGADRALIVSKGLTGFKAKFTKSGALTKTSMKDKKAREQLYKAIWVEFGTKVGKSGSSAQPARPFMQPAFDVNKSRILSEVRAAVKKAVDTSAGGGDD